MVTLRILSFFILLCSAGSVLEAAQPSRRKKPLASHEVSTETPPKAKAPEKKQTSRARRAATPKKVTPRTQRAAATRAASAALAPYRQLQQEIDAPVDKSAGTRQALARIGTGIVPLGLAAGGAHQLLSGNIKTGGALLAGAGMAAIARAIMLKKMLQKTMSTLEHKLKEFIVQWPDKKEKAPPTLQPILDGIYQQYKAHNGQLDAEEMLAFAQALDALAVLARVKAEPVKTERQRCRFLEQELCDIDKNKIGPRFFLSYLLAHTLFIFNLDVFGWVPFLLSPSLRSYATGLQAITSNLTVSEKTRDDQRARDLPLIKQMWPGRLLERFVPKSWRPEDQQIVRFISASIMAYAIEVGVKALLVLLKAGFAARAQYEAHLRTLDSFVTIWPAVKANVPALFHPRFNELYERKFDTKANVLYLSNKERYLFLSQVRKDLAGLRKTLGQEAAAARKERKAHA